MCIIVAKCERGTAHSFAHAVAAAKLQCVWLLAVICLTNRKTYHYSEHTKSKLDTHTHEPYCTGLRAKKCAQSNQFSFIELSILVSCAQLCVEKECEWMSVTMISRRFENSKTESTHNLHIYANREMELARHGISATLTTPIPFNGIQPTRITAAMKVNKLTDARFCAHIFFSSFVCLFYCDERIFRIHLSFCST